MIEQGYRVWFNGAIVHESEARVSASSRAASYGDGCFETLRSYSGKFVRWNKHIERLQEGMKYLGIGENSTLKTAVLKKSVRRLLQINRLDTIDCRIRIQVWRSGIAGEVQSAAGGSLVHISARPATPRQDPIDLIVAETRRIPSASVDSRYKLSNYLNYILAAREAALQNVDDALMLTIGGKVSECSVANIFWLKDKLVYTPSLACDPLPGITRGLTIDFLKASGYQVQEGSYEPEDIRDSEAVWICNSIREWQPVRSVRPMKFNSESPDFIRLRKSFSDFIQTELE